MSVKINSFELENVKRIRAVKIEPSASGLTVIGGRNNQGKTSVLDAIAWALGGDRFKPSSPLRDGSVLPPYLHVELSNGLVVERKGKNSELKVTDPSGEKSGQQLLNEFISSFSLDLPKFMNAASREKADILLQIIGISDRLQQLEQQEKETYHQRHAIGQIAEQKKKHAEEIQRFQDVPDNVISASEMIRQQQEILARNGENARKRQNRARYDMELEQAQIAFEKAKERLQEAAQNASAARQETENLQDESTRELEENIADIERMNAKILSNLQKDKAEQEAKEYSTQYAILTEKIEEIRKEKYDLLHNAELPLPELSVEDRELVYKGKKWDSMSGSEQLMVSASIVRKINPRCGFVLLDKLEQMDAETLNEFGTWLEEQGMQAIATRVSTGGECSVIIEDGYAVMQANHAAHQSGGMF